jgi:hypothetical protein
MTVKNKIEFTPTSASGQQKAPWDRAARSPYEDLIFKSGFVGLKLNLENGLNWIRVVPALGGSDEWMTHVTAVTMHHGRFPHPCTFQEGDKSIFEKAYRWIVANAPDKLYNRDQPKGHRLLCDSLCAFWCLLENKTGGVQAKLFLGSSRKASGKIEAGLGRRIWHIMTEPDPDVDVISDPLDPERGTMICIDKSQAPGAKYPVYHLRVGRQPSPIQEMLNRMDPSEFEALCAIENTIRKLTDDEQYEQLVRVVGADTAAEIRSSNA